MMSQTISPVVPPTTDEVSRVDPDHFIICLDQHIGLRNECEMLKCSFCLAMNPTTGSYERSLNPDDIDRSLLLDAPLLVQLDEVEFMLQAFESVERCFETTANNLHKRIFLITSGSKGKILIPSLAVNFPETFKAEYWMYVFCANMNMIQVPDVEPTNTWALKFADRILMYDHQDHLLCRMVFDIACYFLQKAEDLMKIRQVEGARQYLSWAKQMYTRYGMMTKKDMTLELSEVQQLLANVEQLRRQQSSEDDDAMGDACDE